MKKRTNKGFTLTELIIVIVIIGILAAVLIPTLTACVKKAKISNDKQLVRNLNLALASDDEYIESGKKHENMQKALDAALKAGYIVDRINATKADNEILWDSENDVFCYLNGDDIEYIPSSVPEGKQLDADDPAQAVKLWQIVKLTSGNLTGNRFSVYAAPGSEVIAITTNKGFDAGELAFPTINYDRTNDSDKTTAHEVIIRTNSASTHLTINSEKDTVNHYNSAGSVDIIAIANSSYHENGTVAFLEIAKGRVALEETSKVTQIHISTQISEYNQETGEKTKIDNTFDKVIVALANGVNVPDFSRDEVALSSITSEGTLVVEIEKTNNQSDYVYLFQQGLVEQIQVTSGASTNSGENVSAKTIAEGSVAGNSSSLSSNTSSIAIDIANNLKAGSSVTQEQIISGTINVEDIEDGGLNQAQKEEKQNTLVETAVDKEIADADESGYWITCAADDFAGGSGTENDPYLIKTARQLALLAKYTAIQSTSVLYSDYSKYTSNDVWYKVVSDIDLSGKAWTPIAQYSNNPFLGHFDGDNHLISNLSNNGISVEKFELETSYTYEIIISCTKGAASGGVFGLFGIVGEANISNIKFSNFECINPTSGNGYRGVGAIAGLTYGAIEDKTLTIDNCHVLSGNINVIGKVGGLVGDINDGGEDINASIMNCTNYASIAASRGDSSSEVGGIVGRVENLNKFYMENCHNYGAISGKGNGAAVGGLIGSLLYAGSSDPDTTGYQFIDCSSTLTVTSINHQSGLVIGGSLSNYDNGYYITLTNFKVNTKDNNENWVSTEPEDITSIGILGYGGESYNSTIIHLNNNGTMYSINHTQGTHYYSSSDYVITK